MSSRHFSVIHFQMLLLLWILANRGDLGNPGGKGFFHCHLRKSNQSTCTSSRVIEGPRCKHHPETFGGCCQISMFVYPLISLSSAFHLQPAPPLPLLHFCPPGRQPGVCWNTHCHVQENPLLGALILYPREALAH